MTSLKSAINSRLDKWSHNRLLMRTAFNSNALVNPLSTLVFGTNKPEWISLKTPGDFEKAVRFNPVVKATMNILATASSNGKKQLIDSVSGDEIPWTDKNEVVQKLKKLLTERPNPLQSAKEFQFQGSFYLNTFGNRYVFGLMPSGMDKKLDIMMVEVLYNLPSQFMQVHTTGKIYSQTELKGIIKNYARTNVSPVELYEPETILHFNDVNFSSEQATIMGISKLEALQQPISNIQACFEAMNSILTSRGMQGIVSVDSRDGTGTIVPLSPKEQTKVDDKFKNDYGLLNGQNPFLLSPVPLTYIKTAMNSEEMGIYKEFSNNSILVGNEFNVPPELIKTYIEGATYENQVQSVRRLYQDVIIPSVNDEDQYWNYRLNLDEHGIKITTKWDHIPALQDAFKDKASAINLKGRTAKDAYAENIITWNQYLELLELPTVKEGDKYRHERKINVDLNENNQS